MRGKEEGEEEKEKSEKDNNNNNNNDNDNDDDNGGVSVMDVQTNNLVWANTLFGCLLVFLVGEFFIFFNFYFLF